MNKTTYGKLTDLQTKEEFDILGFDYINNYNYNINNFNFNINNHYININYINNINNINNYYYYINNNYKGIYFLPKINFNSKVLLVEFKEKESFFAKVEKVNNEHKEYTVVFTKYIKNNLEVMKLVGEKTC